MGKRIIESILSTAKYISALAEYFSAKDKVLWESASDWTTGSKKIENLQKYRSFMIYPYSTLGGILCHWNGSAIQGAGIVQGVSVATVNTAFEFRLTVSGENVTISRCQYISHSGATHSSGTAWIRKIVGVDPVIPDVLKEIVGGGYRLLRNFCQRGGVLYGR